MEYHDDGSPQVTAGALARLCAWLDGLDRRFIYLAMAIAIAGPILLVNLIGGSLPVGATAPARSAFRAIEDLPPGSRIAVFFDYDPASAGELQPMSTSIILHCMQRGHRIYGASLWPGGAPLITTTFERVLGDNPNYRYGENYCDLGYQAGNEGVMTQANTDLLKAFPLDTRGTPTSKLPMMQGVTRLGDFDVLVSVSAGYPGAKEWVQFSVSKTLTDARPLKFIAGTTGVQTPQILPYYPGQATGYLGAIKGAAEYEAMVNESIAKASDGAPTPAKFEEAKRRMAPQLGAHVLMVLLIIVGNVVYFVGRRARAGGATA